MTVRRNVGDVVQVALPNGQYAYGRVLRDAAVAFYRARTSEPVHPPVGSRDFQFVVGVYDDDLRRWPVVGHHRSTSEDEDWPPPSSITDPITKQLRSIYERGEIRPLRPGEDGTGLESAAVWEHREILERLMEPRNTVGYGRFKPW